MLDDRPSPGQSATEFDPAGRRRFWRARLAEVSPLPLPVDQAGVTGTPHRAEHRVRVPADIVAGLRELAVRGDTSVLAVLAAAWQVLLSRHCDTDDVVIGVRPGVGDPATVGCPPDGTAVLRTSIVAGQPFQALVAEVARSLAEACRNWVPPASLAAERYGEPDPYQSLLRVQVVQGGPVGGPADLSFVFDPTAETMAPHMVYDAGRFTADRIRRLGEQLATLLTGVVGDPGRTVGQLPLLSPREHHELTLAWNDTDLPYPADRCVHELLADIARERPDEAAVIADRSGLTYAELDRLANGLAHRLVGIGVGPESPVGVLVDRSPFAVVAMLAVLKAGGAYVPLHDSYPPDRVRWILRDTGAVALLTDRVMSARCAEAGIRTVVVDRPGEAPPRPDAPPVTTRPHQLAYVMFTSGSTGTPKGVAVTHANIVSLAWDRRLRTEASRRTLFHSPHAFDAATYEMWVPLLMGGQVVVAPGELTATMLSDLVGRHGITAVFLTTALFRLFAEERPGCLATLAEVWTGGEAPSQAAMERVLRSCPDTTVFHVYGPTETTTFATARATTLEQVRDRVAVIGPPMDNTRCYVLDRHLRPVPVGVPGELYLAGAGTARGYLGRPGLTAERFVADPFRPGGRLYRTGDLARWTEDGEIEFLGRSDHQVKIRGFRIELGEIEATLRRCPGVADAVVSVHATSQSKLLVAHVAAAAAELTEDRLRDSLQDLLPSYLVPARFVLLDRLPMNANGKVDRSRLRPAEAITPATDYVAPRVSGERVLAEIWAEVLRLPRVGVSDNFFALGGDSILAMKVASRAQARGLHLDSRDLFLSPTVAELAEVAAREPSAVVEAASPVPTDHADAEVEDGYPLTPMQSGMLFDELVAGGPAVHLIQFDLVIDGVDDPLALGSAWQRAVARHPVLRTAVVWEDVEEPTQYVRRSVTLPVRQLDWRTRPEQEQRSEFDTVRRADHAQGMRLDTAPLSRLVIARLTDASVRVLWSVHHLIIDGWSSSELISEILTDYRAAGGESGTDTHPVTARRPFRDYQAWLAAQDHQSADRYWEHRLQGYGAPTRLPTDHKPAEGHRFLANESVRIEADAELTAAVAAYAKRTGITVNTVLQGAWAVLLARYGGEHRVCFGTASSVRPAELAGAESILGLLINAQPALVDVDPDRQVADWLRELQRAQVTAREFAAAPLPRVQALAELPSGADLFDSVLVFQNFPSDRRPGPGELALRSFDVEFNTIYPIALSIFPEDRLQVRVLYDPEVYRRTTVERIAGHLLTLVRSITGETGNRVGDLRLHTDAEQEVLLRHWAGGSATYPVPHRVHQLIMESARAWPDAVAVERGEDRLSYRELTARSNQLAHHLSTLGVGRDVLVGLSMERGPDYVVGVLGVLRAGGAYVPLDPDYPASRLATMVDEARPAVIITHQRHLDHLGDLGGGAVTVVLDRDRREIDRRPTTAPADRGDPSDLVYVVYTSGSTGRPKGVMLEHRSLVNTVMAVVDFHLAAGSRVYQLCPMSFDAASLDLFSTLVVGGTLVAPESVSGGGGAAAIDQLGTSGATAVTAPPSVLPALRPDALPALVHVRAGGEVLAPELARRWSPGRKLTNNYGPTEGATAVTVFPVEPGVDYDNVPIGTPIANDRVYLLDSRLALVPTGVPGEIYIGGTGVARGYVGRPGLTAERFVADPFGPPGARLYRTGDLARWTAEGLLEFVGRGDDQVKIRGFRVEPREVANILLRHPAVAEAAVVVSEDRAGKRLIAYVVLRQASSEPDSEALRGHVAEFAPEYMVPAAVVAMPGLPLNRNGKLDRAALPAPELRTDPDRRYRAPSTPTEEALCRIWSEVLAAEHIGVEDSFFDLGGDSISSIRAVSRMRAAFGVSISPQDLFDHPEIATLASTIEDRILQTLPI